MTVRDILTDQSKWTRYADARDTAGVPRAVNHSDATKYSVMGALLLIYSGDALQAAIDAVNCSIREQYGEKFSSIGEWNDSSNLTFDEVLEVIERANV